MKSSPEHTGNLQYRMCRNKEGTAQSFHGTLRARFLKRIGSLIKPQMSTDSRSNHPTCDGSPPSNSPTDDGSGSNEVCGSARSKYPEPEAMVIIALVIISIELLLNAV